MSILSLLASVGMAVCPPLVYADQAWSIQRKRDSEGFSKDVCAVLLIANITRLFFWLGEHFEIALLVQSILMIIAQLYLLGLLIKYRAGSFANARFNAAPGDGAVVFDSTSGGATHAASGGANSAASAARFQSPPISSTLPTVRVDPPTPSPSSRAEAQTAPSSPRETGPNPIANVLGGLSSLAKGDSARGSYAPILGKFQLPAAPTLGLEDDDGEGEGEGDAAEGAHDGTAATATGQDGERTRKPAGWLKRTFKVVKASAGTGEGKRADGSDASRPFGFWTWPSMSSYIIFLLGLVGLLAVLQVFLGGFEVYVAVLGYIALGLESTLPIPQAIKNQQRKSLGGFRMSVLAGWVGGDLFKTGYFVAQNSPAQFTVCALFQVSVDLVIVAQLYFFREQTRLDNEALDAAEAEALEAGRSAHAPIVDEGSGVGGSGGNGSAAKGAKGTKGANGATKGSGAGPGVGSNDATPQFQIEADSDDDEERGAGGR